MEHDGIIERLQFKKASVIMSQERQNVFCAKKRRMMKDATGC